MFSKTVTQNFRFSQCFENVQVRKQSKTENYILQKAKLEVDQVYKVVLIFLRIQRKSLYRYFVLPAIHIGETIQIFSTINSKYLLKRTYEKIQNLKKSAIGENRAKSLSCSTGWIHGYWNRLEEPEVVNRESGWAVLHSDVIVINLEKVFHILNLTIGTKVSTTFVLLNRK